MSTPADEPLESDYEGNVPPKPDLPPINVEQIQAEARESITVADLLNDSPKLLTTGKVLVFRDMDAVTAYNEVHLRAEQLREILASRGRMQGDDEPTEWDIATRKRNEADLAALEPEEEGLRAAMLKGALSVHMRGFPDVAVKVAQREARKIFIDPDTKQMREMFEPEDSADWMEKRLIGEAITKVVDSSGATLEFGVPRQDMGFLLAGKLHAGQWQAIVEKYTEVVLVAGVTRAAIEDPGF